MVTLDAWPVAALLKQEAAAPRIVELCAEDAVVSWVTLGEVIHGLTRSVGREAAEAAVRLFATTVRAELPDEELVLAAAAVKARGGLSYADAFAVATSVRHGAPLLTGDPELVGLDVPGLEVVDLRG